LIKDLSVTPGFNKGQFSFRLYPIDSCQENQKNKEECPLVEESDLQKSKVIQYRPESTPEYLEKELQQQSNDVVNNNLFNANFSQSEVNLGRNINEKEHQRSQSQVQKKSKKSWLFSFFQGKKQKPVIPGEGSFSTNQNNLDKEYRKNIMYTQPDEPESARKNRFTPIFTDTKKEDPESIKQGSDNLFDYLKTLEQEGKQENTLKEDIERIHDQENIQKLNKDYDTSEESQKRIADNFLQNQKVLQIEDNFGQNNESKNLQEKQRSSSVPTQKILMNNWQFSKPSVNQYAQKDSSQPNLESFNENETQGQPPKVRHRNQNFVQNRPTGNFFSL